MTLPIVHLTPAERALARGVHVRPAADGHYYDMVNAAIADRDELLFERERLRATLEGMRDLYIEMGNGHGALAIQSVIGLLEERP